MFAEASHALPQLGVDVGKPKLNLKAMMAHKDDNSESQCRRRRLS